MSRCRLVAHLILSHALLTPLARVQPEALPRAHPACTTASLTRAQLSLIAKGQWHLGCHRDEKGGRKSRGHAQRSE